MKKVGIITLFGYVNYGNKLQNYAVQHIFEKAGYTAETIVCTEKWWYKSCARIYHWGKELLGDRTAARKNRFRRFTKEYLPVKDIYSKDGCIPSSISSDYSFFVVGSDQVWNPEIKLSTWNYFLRFASKNQRICLSPSIAAEKIPPEKHDAFEEGLNGFYHLSCREEKGAELIYEMTGKKCEWLIDPTLFISKDEWLEFEKPVQRAENYVLCFFLGSISENTKARIEQYSKKNDLKVIYLNDPQCEYYVSDPQQFVWMINHARMVFTDSFHATAFSINMNTPFYIFERKEKHDIANHVFSRMESLAEMFELQDRCVSQVNDMEFSTDCDFQRVNTILFEKRKEMQKYIDVCLNQKEDNLG